jgi:hypothetical protein
MYSCGHSIAWGTTVDLLQAVMSIGDVPDDAMKTWVQKLNDEYRHVRS